MRRLFGRAAGELRRPAAAGGCQGAHGARQDTMALSSSVYLPYMAFVRFHRWSPSPAPRVPDVTGRYSVNALFRLMTPLSSQERRPDR